MSSHRIRNISKSVNPVFKIGQLLKLKELFDKHHWHIDESLELSYFERYVRTLSRLQEEQQNFIIKLSERFLHLPQADYPMCLVKSIKHLREEHMDDNLLLACCLPKSDIGKVKSSMAVLYQFKGTTIKSQVDLGKHYVIESFTPATIAHINVDKSHFVLVDDFVGTGETAKGAIDYIHELFPALSDNKRISILSIVAMKEGIDAITATGATVYASIICKRGISDYYRGEELVNAKDTMEAIEQRLKKLKPEFQFGYGQSEALVCMERCPNNTFPIYWYTKHDAPYER